MLSGVGTAPDGSPLRVYERLPELGEGEVVAAVVPAGRSVLELGAGVGRITRQLVRLGYVVTAVDESAEMLAHVRDAETVQASIEELELGRRFDAVLLASNLVNAEPEQRRAFLNACRRPADLAVVEGLPLGSGRRRDDARGGRLPPAGRPCRGRSRPWVGGVRGGQPDVAASVRNARLRR